jgi:hypothetical protein
VIALAGLLPVVSACSTRHTDSGDADLECTGTARGDDPMLVEDVLDDEDHPCREWIESTHGRAVRVDSVGDGSGSIWTRRTESGVAVLTTAAHVMSPCWPIVSAMEDMGVSAPECSATLYDPQSSPGEATIRLAEQGGGPAASQWSAHFPLMNPPFPVDEVLSGALEPRDDFSVYVVDSQRFEAYSGGAPIVPESLVEAPPELYDPRGYADTEPTWAEPVPGEDVITVGFPGRDENPNGRLMGATVGTVLDDDEARAAIDHLAQLGDEEGGIPYDPQVDLLIEARGLPGMSGSGVFDERGAQVGIAIRASFTESPPHYLRAVRMSWVVAEMQRLLAALPDETRARVARFLPF